MDAPNLLLAVIWILVAPFATDSGITPSIPDRPAGSITAGAPDSSYWYAGSWRLRTVLPDVSMETPREFAIGMVCALGVVALALMDCDETGAEEVLVLSPVSGARSGTSAPETSARRASAPGGPDVLDLRRRSIEQRMHSI